MRFGGIGVGEERGHWLRSCGGGFRVWRRRRRWRRRAWCGRGARGEVRGRRRGKKWDFLFFFRNRDCISRIKDRENSVYSTGKKYGSYVPLENFIFP